MVNAEKHLFSVSFIFTEDAIKERLLTIMRVYDKLIF